MFPDWSISPFLSMFAMAIEDEVTPEQLLMKLSVPLAA